MTFLDALATGKPMRRKAWEVPSWAWVMLMGDNGWNTFDAEATEAAEETWYDGADRLTRYDFLATDWEVYEGEVLS